MGKLKLKGRRITQLATSRAKAHHAELAESFLERLPLDSAGGRKWPRKKKKKKKSSTEKTMKISAALSA